MNFKQSIISLLTTYITLVALFVISRIYWFFSFVKPDYFENNSLWETFYVFIMSLRLDSSASVLLILIPLIGTSFFPFIKFFQPWWKKIIINYIYLVLTAAVLLIVLNHFYYYYYKVHFNLFFWEFWINWENSKLVIWSIFDELPILSVLASLLSFITIGLITFHFVNKKLQCSIDKKWLFKFPGLLIWIIFISISARATFDVLPLSLQFNRGLISTNMFLNKAHSNPVYTLYLSWQENNDTEQIKSIVNQTASLNNAKQYFDQYSLTNENRFVMHRNNTLSMNFKVPVFQSKYLLKKPKHIVLIFMESFFAWPLDINENEFNYKVAANFMKLKNNGLYFSDYFRASSGTIQNIYKTILGISSPRDLPLERIREQYQNLETLPRVMKEHGYLPRFFYGGSLAWHRLYHFLNEVGFEEIYGENSVKDVPHTRFGIFDEHLFDFVHSNLKHSTDNTFSFIMTLSNHPPYQMPETYKVKNLTIPPILKQYANDEEYFIDRFNAFSYSDTALGHFIKKAKTEDYYKDTLFIITADHPVDYFSNWDFISRYQLEKLPLLFYSPLLIENKKGIINNRGTHLDLLPTILSLINKKSENITTWGKSLFEQSNPDYLNSYSINCLNNFCISESGNHLLDNNQSFKKCNGNSCKIQEIQLKSQIEAFEMSGIYYLLKNN